VDDVLQAEAGGASRIELNAALALGGLTPSLGVFRQTRAKTHLPLLVMLRPRAGGFCYTASEFDAMETDLEIFAEAGADGFVLGILHEDGSLDEKRCKRLLDRAGNRPVVFHRAFDVTPDPFKTLDQLIALGFTRVLTSGQERTALEGADLIHRLVEHADGRIEILPGGGIRPHNVHEVLRRTGCNQVHCTAFSHRIDPSLSARPHIRFNSGNTGTEEECVTVDPEKVRAMVERLRETEDA
jgi:copper homeostasis protein